MVGGDGELRHSSFPLPTYGTDNDVTTRWQFNKPETGVEMVQAFCRPQSRVVSREFKCRGLDPNA